MKFLSTIYLSYICLADGLCYTNLVYPKETYVILKVNIYRLYDIIILEPFIFFCNM